MLPDEILSEPDAILLTEDAGTKIIDFVTPYTIPLFFFRDDLSKPWKFGTGTLLQLNDRGFVLTAGHCVEDLRVSEACAVTIARRRHTFVAKFKQLASRYIPETSIDVGVLEVASDQYEAYRAYDRIYMGPGRIRVRTSAELVSANDWMVVSGYPDEVALTRPDGKGMRLLAYSTTIAGLGPAPRSPIPASAPSSSTIDLWMPRDRQLQTFPQLQTDVDLPLFGGASGGGCWETGIRAVPRTYNPEDPRLQFVGVHIGSTVPLPSYGRARFATEVLVGHHLRLLADEFEDMHDPVLRWWPQVADEVWTL